MRSWVAYAAAGLALVVTLVGVLWPFLGEAGRRGILWGGLIAYPVQVVAFGLLLRYRDRINRFLAVWIGGTLVRFGVVLSAGLLLARQDTPDPLVPLLSLAGFFFGLLLLEPFFFRPGTLELS